MNAITPEINPQAILASTISHIYGSIFGYSLYAMRTWTFILTIAAIGSSVIYFYYVNRKLNLSLLLFVLLLSASLCEPVKSRLIGWDSYAVLFTTFSLITIMELWRNGGYRHLIWLGIFSGCATLSRIPDIVIVPVAILALFVNNRNHNIHPIKKSAIYLGTYVTTIVILLCIIYNGNPIEWVMSLKTNFVSGHTLTRLINSYIHTGTLDLVDIILLSLFIIIAYRFCPNNRYLPTLFIALFLILTVILSIKIDRLHYTVCRLLTSCVIIMSGIYLYSSEKNIGCNH